MSDTSDYMHGQTTQSGEPELSLPDDHPADSYTVPQIQQLKTWIGWAKGIIFSNVERTAELYRDLQHNTQEVKKLTQRVGELTILQEASEKIIANRMATSHKVYPIDASVEVVGNKGVSGKVERIMVCKGHTAYDVRIFNGVFYDVRQFYHEELKLYDDILPLRAEET